MATKADEMSLIEHLEELRRVIIVSLLCTLVLAVASYFYIDKILAVLLEPLTATGNKIFFTGITEAFFVKIKLSLFIGFLAALPVILWQVWGFIVPALKKNERTCFTLFVVLSFFFFWGGVIFAFFGVYRLGIMFLLRFAGPELMPMLTIDKYISFTMSFLLPFGFVFELPLVSFLLANLELISYKFLAKSRRYALLAIVILAAVITPTPDIITCLLVSGPVYLLYEASAAIVKVVERKKERKRKMEEMADLALSKSS